MHDQFGRWLIALLCGSGALALVAASMFMNFTFWSGQGTDVPTARVLGAVSIGIDVFKATLPLVIAWAWAARIRLGYLIGSLFFCGCLAFSFFSALGFAASTHGAVTGGREAVSRHYAAIEQELQESKDRLGRIGTPRPSAVIEEALFKSKQDRRWSSSNECKEATVEVSRAFCKTVGDLRMELASAVEGDRLRERSNALKAESDRLVGEGARLEQDQQAGLLARLSGLHLQNVQTMMVVLLATLVELGAAFGLFLAMLPLQCVSRATAVRAPVEILPAIDLTPNKKDPTRFVRAPDGQLMIE